MGFFDPAAEQSPTTGDAQSSRWPRVVGTIGIVAGVLMFLDKLDDLLMLPLLRSADWWESMVGQEMADRVVRWIPSPAWIVFASLIGMTLGSLLVVGGVRLRRRRRSGVALCQAWAWLALVWLLAEIGWSLSWLSGHAAELQELAQGDWQRSAVLGILLVLAVLAAFPIFLLSWFARPAIKSQLAAWSP